MLDVAHGFSGNDTISIAAPANVPTYVLGTNPTVSAGLEANFPQLHVPCSDCPQIVWAEGARAGATVVRPG